MNILITICARSGSKRIKNKNIRKMVGKPLIYYAIELAKKWGKAKRIVCSTNSKKIAEVAKKAGAEVPFIRKKQLAKDKTGKVPVIKDTLIQCEKFYKEKYDIIVDLDITNPLKNTRDLNNCLKIYKEKNPEILFSVTESKRNPYFNMVELNRKGFAEISKKPRKKVLRTQDAPKVYSLNASIYFYSRNFLLNPKTSYILPSKAAIYIMGEITAVDIDTELDLKHIEFLIKNKVVPL